MRFPFVWPGLGIHKSGRNLGEDRAHIRNAVYITTMAHNNGMVPRAKKSRAAKGMQEASAKYQAAVDSLSVFRLEGDPAIDPAYQTVPIAEFVPHRPARPEK